MSSYKKGLELEKLIAKLFKVKGYETKHNVKLIGRSGVKHQIDVLAEYRAPLHVSRIIIECKSYDKPIDKDIIMKLIQEVQDLGVDRGILVTTSYFTPDAVSTAKGYNIDLWDGTKLRNLLKEVKIEEISILENVFYVKPLIPVEEATKTVEKSLKTLFGRRGHIKSSSIVFYPFYELIIDAKISEIKGFLRKKIEEKIITATILVDAINGSICNYDPKTGIIRIVTLPELSDEESEVFRILLRQEALTTPALASLLGCSTAKARKLLQGLVVKGICETIRRERQIFYRLRIRIPNLILLRPISTSQKIEQGSPKEGIVIEPKVSLRKIEKPIKLLWNGSIKEYKTIYYPYYACEIVEEAKRHIKAVDMQTNEIDEVISKLLTSLYSELPLTSFQDIWKIWKLIMEQKQSK